MELKKQIKESLGISLKIAKATSGCEIIV